MAMSYNDEFDYLEEDSEKESKETPADAPIIRGAKKKDPMIPSEDNNETAEELEEEVKESPQLFTEDMKYIIKKFKHILKPAPKKVMHVLND